MVKKYHKQDTTGKHILGRVAVTCSEFAVNPIRWATKQDLCIEQNAHPHPATPAYCDNVLAPAPSMPSTDPKLRNDKTMRLFGIRTGPVEGAKGSLGHTRALFLRRPW